MPNLTSYCYPQWKLAALAWSGGATVPRTAMETRLTVPEGTHISLLGQIYTEDGTLLQASECDKIVLRVFEKPADAPASEVYSGTLIVGDGTTGVVLNTPGTDARWRGDSVGYNFRSVVSAAQLLARGGTTTRYEVTITLVSGGPIRQAWEVNAASFLGGV